MEDLTPLIMGWLRHLITTAAGALIAHGWLQSTQQEQFIGACLLLAGLAWSSLKNWYAHKSLREANVAVQAAAIQGTARQAAAKS